MPQLRINWLLLITQQIHEFSGLHTGSGAVRWPPPAIVVIVEQTGHLIAETPGG